MSQIKKIVCLAALPCLVATTAHAAPHVQQRYPSQSGRVVYRMTMAMGMNSNITTSWTDYGRKFRHDIKMTMNMPSGAGAGGARKPMVINTWAISDGNYVYSAMPGQRKMVRMPIPKGDLEKIPGMDSLKQMGLIDGKASSKVIGKGTVLGKPTTIRSVVNNAPKMNLNGKIWLWGGLPLRMDLDMKFKGMPMPANAQAKGAPKNYTPQPMKVSMVATKLDLNAKPAASLFKVPAGYAVQDMADLQKKMLGRGR